MDSTRYREIDGRNMRSLADALERLCELGSLNRGDEVEIRAWSFPMPDGRRAGFVWILGPPDARGSVPVIEMPPAAIFKAKTKSSKPISVSTGLLSGAHCGHDGNVRLQSGECLRSVDLVPAAARYKLTPREEAILLAVLCCLNKYGECYPEVYGSEFPGVRAFPSDRIFEIYIDNLQELHRQVNKLLKTAVSLSVMTKALKRTGLQLPRTRTSRSSPAPLSPE